MNTVLLQKVKAAILREPRQFLMDSWFDYRSERPNCGTAACIGGWAMTLSSTQSKKPADGRYAWWERKADPFVVLGLNDMQGRRLFFLQSWPEKFQNRYRRSLCGERLEDAEHNAQVAADRIDHFIATGGDE